MLWKGTLWLGALLSAHAVAKPPTLDELLKPDQYTLVNISPSGEYLAVGTRLDDKVLVAFLDRQTFKVVHGLDPVDKGAVERVVWVGDKRVFVLSSTPSRSVHEKFIIPAIVALNVDGTRRRSLYWSVVDTIANDDEHILVSLCGKENSLGCWNYVQKVDTEGGTKGPRVAEAPMVNADFMADDSGHVRFAYGWDDKDVQRLWAKNGDAWTLLNDEATTAIEIVPIGISSDGKKGYLSSEQRAGPNVIERIDFSTGQRTVVMADPVLDPAFIVWSANRLEPIGAAYGLEVPRARFWDEQHPDARVLRQLEAAFPEDAVSFGSGSRDGQHVIVNVWSDRDPGSTYLLNRADMHSRLIFRRKPWLDPTDMAQSRPIALRARDGLAINGYLTMPTQAASGSNPPLVVLPHGGPFGVMDGWGYDEEVQILASHGYAVLRVNFRGSGGFGRNFIESGYRQWGAKMQDDVTDATRWVMQQGLIDPERTCIWGSSYGGYAALMGSILEPDLYKCVIATSAVTDLNLMWRWGDIQRSKSGRSYLEEGVGKDPKFLITYSPTRHAAKIKADLMLAHGVRDTRVSYEHAKAMTKALDDVGKAYEGYFPKNETHGFYGEENRKEYYQRVLKFLEARIGSASR